MPTIHGVDHERLKALSLGSGNRDFFQLPKGEYGVEHIIRVLPGCGKMGSLPWVEAHMHFNNLGATPSGFMYKGKSRAIYSLTHHTKDRDPIQEILDWAEENEEGTVERGLKDSPVWYMNIVDRSDGKVKVYGAPKTVATQLKELIDNPRYRDLLDLKKGRDVAITRTKKGKGPVTYTVIPLDVEPVGIEEEDLEEKMKDCTELITPFTPEEVFAILWENVSGIIPLDDIFPDVNFEALHTKYYSEDEEEEQPKRSSRPKAKSKPAPAAKAPKVAAKKAPSKKAGKKKK